jgi:hypothetical protein
MPPQSTPPINKQPPKALPRSTHRGSIPRSLTQATRPTRRAGQSGSQRAMDDETVDDLEQAAPVRCTRCTRAPRNAEDRLAWVTIDDTEICPGCLTMTDNEQLRNDSR